MSLSAGAELSTALARVDIEGVALCEVLLRIAGATPVEQLGAPGQLVVHGRAGDDAEVAVWVADPGVAVTRAEIRELARIADARGFRQLRVLAWSWAFAAGGELDECSDGRAPFDVVCLQVTRALVGVLGRTRGSSPARAKRRARTQRSGTKRRALERSQPVLLERPVARVAHEELGDGRVCAVLCAYDYPHRELLDPRCLEVIERWSDWIDQWTCSRSRGPAFDEKPRVPEEIRVRTHRRRALECASDPFFLAAGESRHLRIDTVDVLGARWVGHVRLSRAAEGGLVELTRLSGA